MWGEFDIEKTLGYMIGDIMLFRESNLSELFEGLKKHGYHGKDNEYDWNDGDNRAFYHETENHSVVCLEDQNHRYAYIFSGQWFSNDFQLKIYQYFDKYNPDMDLEDRGLEDNITMKEAIVSADWFKQYYADDFEDTQYVKRPSLQYFIDNDFKFKEFTHFSSFYTYEPHQRFTNSNFLRHHAGMILVAIDAITWTFDSMVQDLLIPNMMNKYQCRCGSCYGSGKKDCEKCNGRGRKEATQEMIDNAVKETPNAEKEE